MLAVHSEFGPIVIDAPFGHEGPQNGGFIANSSMKLFGSEFKTKWSIIERIRQIGYKSADIDHVLLTHLHFDHTGGMKELAHAKFYVHEPEWNFALSKKATMSKGYSKQDYQALRSVETYSLPEGGDIFGDGSIVAVDLRGHSPGQVGFRIQLGEGGEVIHAADAAYTLGQISHGHSLGTMSKFSCSNYEQAVGTLETVRGMAYSNPDARWITSHDDSLGRLCENGPISLIGD